MFTLSIIGWTFLLNYVAVHTIPYVPSPSTVYQLFQCFLLESTCPNNNITYWLYNRQLDEVPYRLKPSSRSSLKRAPLVEGDLIVLIHGYTGHRDYSPNTELRPAYLEYGDFNIITVDWGQAAMEPCYVFAAFNVERVGECSADLLHQMYTIHPHKLSVDRTHIVGFSLGSHVAGAVGKFHSRKYNQTFPRITGLDPALPMFDSVTSHSEYFLDPSDAEFVDVVHTNAGRKGRLFQVGHVDFYINNAGIQPGCLSNSSCDHVRAVEVFAESISSEEGFWGVPCRVKAAEFLIGFVSEACTLSTSRASEDRLVLMGHHTNQSSTGTYLVRTNDKPPYAKGRMFY